MRGWGGGGGVSRAYDKGNAGEGAEGAARAVLTAGPASPRTTSPTPSSGVCLGMGWQ